MAATLERQWEEAMQQERGIKEEYERHCRQTLPQLGADDEERIKALAADIPALWHSPATMNADRQAIVRCLVERVVVDVEPSSEDTVATIHWIGGFESRHEFARPVRTYSQLCEGDLLMKRIAELREAGKTAEQTADTLNAEGYAPINPGKKFNREIVRKLLLKMGLNGERDNDSLLAPSEWWIHDLVVSWDHCTGQNRRNFVTFRRFFATSWDVLEKHGVFHTRSMIPGHHPRSCRRNRHAMADPSPLVCQRLGSRAADERRKAVDHVG